MIDSIVFSDLHIGSKATDGVLFHVVNAIGEYKPKKVIFVGDTVDLFADKYARLYLELLELSSHTVFLNGNHDPIFNADAYTEIIGDKSFFFTHGHEFMPKATRFLDRPATIINEFLLKTLNINFQLVARSLTERKCGIDYFVPHLKKIHTQMIDKYTGFYDVVFFGHTHYFMDFLCLETRFINLGDHKTFAIIHENGNIELKRFSFYG